MLELKFGAETKVILEVKLGVKLVVKLGAKSPYWAS